MNNSAPSILLYISCWSAMVIGIYTLFEKAEEAITLETKAAISDWLNSFDPLSTIRDWPRLFISTFDRIFNSKESSVPSFFRSSIASLASLVVLTLLWGVLHPDQFLNWFSAVGEPDKNLFMRIFVIVFPLFMSCLLNLFPDYLSLCKTRFIIGLIRTKPIYQTGPLFIIDLFITCIIALAALLLVFFIGGANFEEFSFVISRNVLPLSASESTSQFVGEMTYGIYFYSTFFTSVWGLLFIFLGLIMKPLGSIASWLGYFKQVFDIQNKPLRSMGFISIILISIIFMLFPLLSYTI